MTAIKKTIKKDRQKIKKNKPKRDKENYLQQYGEQERRKEEKINKIEILIVLWHK
jgi:hypothetical protein